jgi:hypothetical protein
VESAARMGKMRRKNLGKNSVATKRGPHWIKKINTNTNPSHAPNCHVHVLCLVVAAIQFGQCAAFDQPPFVRDEFDATAAGGDQMQTTHSRTIHD